MKQFGATVAILIVLSFNLLLGSEVPKANINQFRNEIEPVLKAVCFGCHGPDKQKAKFRVDTLNPDLLTGRMSVGGWRSLTSLVMARCLQRTPK